MEVKNNLYFIFNEAVNNLSRYSGESCTGLYLAIEKKFHLKIQYYGKGFNKKEIELCGVLANIQHRAEKIDGIIRINSIIGKETVLQLIVLRAC